MPDIIIYPNRTLITGVPKIDFIGASGSGISLQVTQDGSINFMGTAGNLFSITDSLSGSLMSVNDIAGLPILEVFDTDKVVAGSFGTNALVVSGSGVGIGTDQVERNFVLVVSGNSKFVGQIFSGTVNISDLFYPRSNPSGYVTSSQTGGYATKLELIATGRSAWDNAINLSGNLNATGRRAWDDAINLSGRLFATGALIAGVSGGLEARISASSASTLSSANTYANSIGTNLSGNLTQTGVLLGLEVDTLSGNLYTTGLTLFNRDASISGGLEARIAATGQASIVYTNNVSGGLQAQIGVLATTSALIATGRRAWDDATNISGQLFITGREAVGNFGQADPHMTYLDFLAVPRKWGWTYVWGSTGAPHQTSSQWYRTRISLGSEYNLGAGANSYWLQMAVPRYGNKDIWFQTNENGTTGQWIPAGVTVSGVLQGQINNLATTAALVATGRRAWDDATNISGNLNASGRRAWDDAINLSGRIFATGALIANVSGGLEARISASSASTLSSANTHANGIGLNLSGNLTQTGTLLSLEIDTLSGNLYTTGSTLDNKINSTSGYIDAIFVHKTGIETILGQKRFIQKNNTDYTVPVVVLSGNTYSDIYGLAPYNVLSMTGSDATNGGSNWGFGFLGSASTNHSTKMNAQGYGSRTDYIQGTQYISSSDRYLGFVNYGTASLGTGLYSIASASTLYFGAKVLTGDWYTNSSSDTSGTIVNYFRLTGISGDLQAQIGGFASSSQIIATGRRAWDDAINLSGNLFLTGASIGNVSGGLQAQINAVSNAPNVVYRTGNQYISGFKIFASTGAANTVIPSVLISGDMNDSVGDTRLFGITGRNTNYSSPLQQYGITFFGNNNGTRIVVGDADGDLSVASSNVEFAYNRNIRGNLNLNIGFISYHSTSTGRRIDFKDTTLLKNWKSEGNFTFNSGKYQPFRAVTSDYTISIGDCRIYCNNATPINLTFPVGSSASGQNVEIKLLNTGLVRFTGTNQYFDGLFGMVVSGRYFAVEAHCVGMDGANTNWYLW